MTEGTYDVSLTATGAGGSHTVVKTDYIVASDVIFADGFESGD